MLSQPLQSTLFTLIARDPHPAWKELKQDTASLGLIIATIFSLVLFITLL